MTASRFSAIDRAILRGAMQSMSVRIAGLGLAYAAAILLSRLLGLPAYGHYSIALSWALILALPAKGGFDLSSLRYATVYGERSDHSALRGFIMTAVVAVVALSIAIAGLMILGGTLAPKAQPALVAWAAAMIPVLALLALFSSLMRTARRVIASQFYEQMLRPGLLIAALLAFALSGRHLLPVTALALSTIAAFGALAAMTVHLWRVFSPALSVSPDFEARREWLTVSVPMLLMGVVQEMMNHVEVIMLGIFADARQAGLFAASWRLAGLVPFAFYALSALAAPLLATAHDRKSTEEMFRICRVVARVGFAFAVVASVLLFAFSGWLLGLFGHDFIFGRPVLGVLLAGGLVNAFTGVVGYLMILTGHERQALMIFAGSLALSILLNVILIPRLGATGAAMASSAATASWNLAMLIYVRRTMGIDASALARGVRRDMA